MCLGKAPIRTYLLLTGFGYSLADSINKVGFPQDLTLNIKQIRWFCNTVCINAAYNCETLDHNWFIEKPFSRVKWLLAIIIEEKYRTSVRYKNIFGIYYYVSLSSLTNSSQQLSA